MNPENETLLPIPENMNQYQALAQARIEHGPNVHPRDDKHLVLIGVSKSVRQTIATNNISVEKGADEDDSFHLSTETEGYPF